MKQINIRTSSDNADRVRTLTKQLPSAGAENVIARIALCYSLQCDTTFSQADFGSRDAGGKEYKESVLFDDNKDFYIALVCQHYGLNKDDVNLAKYVKLHVDDGLEKISHLIEQRQNYTMVDFLMEFISKGIDQIEQQRTTFDVVDNIRLRNTLNKAQFTGRLRLKVGYEDEQREKPIFLELNNSSLRSNQHIAVAGTSGSGKTEFAKELLRQLVKESQEKVNFLFLDYKGLSRDDANKMADFFNETKCTLVQAPENKIPFNPLAFIDTINEKNKNFGIDKFSDTVELNTSIGKKQKGRLRDAVRQAFMRHPDGSTPALDEVRTALFNEMGDERDSLTEFLDRLTDNDMFDDNAQVPELICKNIYISLSSDLPNNIRYTSVFFILDFLMTAFTSLGSTDSTDDIRAMRFMIVIDEAHELFKERKLRERLEPLLRKIRSYGVSIFMLSQGIQEYTQNGFDFSTLCETTFLLKTKDAEVKPASRFLGMDAEKIKPLIHMMEASTGIAISNMKEEHPNPFHIVQYYSESKS